MDSISVQRYPAGSEVPQTHRLTSSPLPPSATAPEALQGSRDRALFGRRRAPAGRLSLHLPVDKKPG